MKFVKPNIYFLDEDLRISAQYLTNKLLDYNIRSCCQILMCAVYYFVGIRNKTIFNYYFSKDKYKETLEKWFDTYPLDKKPTFMKYNSPESKWIRKCKNHYDYILCYFKELLDEYSFRFERDHELSEMEEFLKFVMYQDSIKFGLNVGYIKDLHIILPWKSLPLKYRKKDLIEGYRLYYMSLIMDPIMDYIGTKRSTPEFLVQAVC